MCELHLQFMVHDAIQKLIIEESTKRTISFAIDTCKKLSASLAERRKIASAAKTYFERYATGHCLVKVLGMSEPLWLLDVYTTVKFDDGECVRMFSSLQEMRDAFAAKVGVRENLQPDGISVANSLQFLNVLGRPGGGK